MRIIYILLQKCYNYFGYIKNSVKIFLTFFLRSVDWGLLTFLIYYYKYLGAFVKFYMHTKHNM